MSAFGVAHAQEPTHCGDDGRPWIRLMTEGMAAELRSNLLIQARSSISARGLRLCVSEQESASTPPLATIGVKAVGDDVATSISVDDGVTKKRVARDVDLRSIPPDGRAMTIALALDELLRASWAELMLVDAPIKAPVPAVVREAIAGPPAAVSPPAIARETWDLGAGMGAEHFGAGVDQIGVDVFGAFFPWEHLGVQARLGMRFGFESTAPRGSVDSTGLAVALGPRVPIVPLSNRVGLELIAEAILTRVTFAAATEASNVRANEKTVGAGYAALGAKGWLVLSPAVRQIRAFMQVCAGVPIHTAYATDNGVRITGLAGLMLGAELGVSTAF